MTKDYAKTGYITNKRKKNQIPAVTILWKKTLKQSLKTYEFWQLCIKMDISRVLHWETYEIFYLSIDYLVQAYSHYCC
jgi:hypothetical protein